MPRRPPTAERFDPIGKCKVKAAHPGVEDIPPNTSSRKIPPLPSLPRLISTAFLVSTSFLTPTAFLPFPCHALSSNFDVLWQVSPNQPGVKSGFAASALPTKSAYDLIRKEQDLQDQRLTQCEESGPDSFEQCFFYGTQSPTASKGSSSIGKNPFSIDTRVVKGSGTGIPTW